MTKYHVMKNGDIAECKATTNKCPLDTPHIEAANLDEASTKAAEALEAVDTGSNYALDVLGRVLGPFRAVEVLKQLQAAPSRTDSHDYARQLLERELGSTRASEIMDQLASKDDAISGHEG